MAEIVKYFVLKQIIPLLGNETDKIPHPILHSDLIKLAQSSKKRDMIEVNKPINIFELGA